MRRLGAGSPPLHRFRLGLEFAVSGPPRGGRHDRAARRARPHRSPSSSGCPSGCSRARRRLVRAVGRQAAGRTGVKGDADPGRGADRAARGVRRGRASRRGRPARRRRSRASASGKQFDPAICGAAVRRARRDPRRPRLGADLGRGDRGRARARGHALGRAVRRGARGDRELRRPQVAVHARTLACGRGARGRGRRAARAAGRRGAACCDAPASSTTSAGSASRTRSGTSAGRSARASGSASGCIPT